MNEENGKDLRLSAYASALINKDGKTEYSLDAIQHIVGKTLEVLNEVSLDGVEVLAGETPLNMDTILANTIIQAHAEAGKEMTLDSLDASIMTISKAVEKYDLDSATAEARGIIAQLVGLNIYATIDAELPFAGNISNFAGDKNSSKFKIYYTTSEVVGKMGELAVGDELDGANAYKKFAMLNRKESQELVAGTLAYTYNLKTTSDATENYKMKRGVNEVCVGGSLFLDDMEADGKAKKSTRELEAFGTTVEAVFDYEAGTIVVTLGADPKNEEGDPLAGKVSFSGVLDTMKLDDVTGVVTVDIVDENYVATPIVIDTRINAYDAREAFQGNGVNIKTAGLQGALQKIKSETAFAKIQEVRDLAVPFGVVVDIANAPENTELASRYKRVIKAVGMAKADILTKAQVGGEITVMGGSAVVDIVEALSTTSGEVRTAVNSQNGIRHLATIGSVGYYFDPTHDLVYPTTGGEDKILVIGSPANDLKKPVLSGIGLAILPEGDISEITGNKTTRLLGSVIVSKNKNEKARKQVRELTVKL